MANIIRLPHTKKFPKSKLYPKYNEIKEYHCFNLLEFLYKDKDEWFNPMTKKFIHRNSDIVVSILSKCHYVFGDIVVILNNEKLTYKEHVEKFIDKSLLFDVSHLPVSPNSLRMQQHALRVQQQAAVVNKPKTNSPPKSPMGAATNKPKTNSPPKSPMGAATNKPRSPQQGIAAAVAVANSKKPIRFNSKSTKAKHDKNSERLNEGLCLRFVKQIKETLQKAKTSAELKGLKFTNPVTGNLIGIESPILRSFLSKCYYSFNKNKEIKDVIEEIANVSDLIEDDKVAALTPVINYVTLKINEAIDDAIKAFHKCCDEIEANCNAIGMLKEHILISNLVNSIMAIIHIRYMHLGNLYTNFAIKDKKPLQIYMHDEAFRQEFLNIGTAYDIFKRYHNINRIIYQKNDLEVSNVITDLNPKNLDAYHTNNLFNRQYVFEYPSAPILHQMALKNTLYFNKVNFKILEKVAYPKSLELAKAAFDYVAKQYHQFDYNITNSTLPKYVFTNDDSEISKYFEDIIELVNNRLKTLPDIKGFVNETTLKKDFYDMVIAAMEKVSFGNNETAYGEKNMIRKNILYSLNAQTKEYMINHSPNSYDNLFYYSKFSGTFPLFTWIPLNPLNPNKPPSIYNYANAVRWQPLNFSSDEVLKIDRTYKNNGIPPWSKWLNETIYKVITDEYASVKSLINPQRIEDMKIRIQDTIGIYKDMEINPNYDNKNIYLYHGTKTKLHNIANTYHEDIEILGFLSTTLNMYTASYYAGAAENSIGLIYIIEVDNTHTYINLKDQLLQFLLLPNSRLRVIYEFNYGEIRVVICRLIRTPTIAMNYNLYNKLLDAQAPDHSKYYVSYIIKNNNNVMPVCAFMLSKNWNKGREQGNRNLKVFSIRRDKLNNKEINNTSMSKKSLGGRYLYFSLGQEYELYVDRGLPLIAGSFEDIKYSIHQHFIKDCYKAMGIPCLDYIFIHSAFVNNAISTGILSDDYENNKKHQYKYNINNFLIDCIFKFNSIQNENKELHILDAVRTGKYVDKIEGFRDACMYCNGVINPLFNKDASVGEHIQYMRNWKHIFAKYESASDEDLMKHFKWCNSRIDALIKIIKTTSEHYLKFIKDTLNGKIQGKPLDKKGFIEKTSKEALELFNMIYTLTETLLKRADLFKVCTSSSAEIKSFIDIIRAVLSDGHINTHNSNLYKNPVLDELILDEKEKSDTLTGGILSIRDMAKLNTRIKSNNSKEIDHQKLYEAFKNVPIQESKDMRKYADMPKSFQEYYKGAILDKDGCFDISDHCYCRPVKKV